MTNANAAESAGRRFGEFGAAWRPQVDAELERLIAGGDVEPRDLHLAMRHAVFSGGKRLRPLLALAAAGASGGSPDRALRAAAGLECLHTYSLVHDDLPCMDDDPLRRGRPTCHIVYGEATALLAGDALLTLAFEGVADGGSAAVKALAKAAGSLGMVGGQAADLAAEGLGEGVELAQLESIHDRKTGALITASLEVGALAGGGEPDSLGPLRRYGALIGRAFQIADDCLDLTGTAEELGKQPGQDVARAKATYPALLGLDESLAIAQRLAQEATEVAPQVAASSRSAGRIPSLDLDSAVQLLQDLALFFVSRRA